MLQKYGKWFADWRDAEGRRHRKAFPTRRAAERHQATQAHSKNPTPALSRLRKPSRASSSKTRTTSTRSRSAKS